MTSLFEFSFATMFMAPPLSMIISIKYSISTNKTFARTQRAQYIARLQLTHRISCNSLFLWWEGESTFALQEASPRLNYWWTWCVCTVVGYKLFSGEILYWVTSHPTLLTRLPNVIVNTSIVFLDIKRWCKWRWR